MMIVGARFWVVCQCANRSLLMSPYSVHGWKPQEVKSDGHPWINVVMESHNGIYAAKDMSHLVAFVMNETAMDSLRKRWWGTLKEYNPRALVFGSVRMWGTVIEHERGYRAEHTKVHSLDTITSGPEFTTMRDDGSDLEVLRLIYGV